MTIHINAIGGIDNKKPVVVDAEGNEVVAEEVETTEEVVEDIENSVQEKKSSKNHFSP